MSNRALTAAWKLELPSTEKFVLVALADHADDEKGDICWPSIATLATKTGLSDRAVQKAIAKLEAAGHISRNHRVGYGVVYTVHPRTTFTPPPNDVHPSPEPRSPPPPQDVHPSPEPRSPNPSENPLPPQPSGCAPKGADHQFEVKRGKGKRARATRLPLDWQPAPLPPDLATPADRQGEAWLERQLANFRDHYAAAAGARGQSADWDANWRKWLRNGLDREGIQASADRPAELERSDAPPAVGDGLDAFRLALWREIGAAAYRGWVAPCAMSIDGDALVIASSGRAARERLADDYLPRLRLAAKAAGLSQRVEVVFRAEAKAAA